MQVGHHHRHPVKIVRIAEDLVVRRALLVRAGPFPPQRGNHACTPPDHSGRVASVPGKGERMSRRKTERLLSLVVCLLSAGRFLTATQIRDAVPGYPDSFEAFKRMFERDKDELRE